MAENVLEDYECDGQISLDQFLWDSGYYMSLPITEEE